MDTDDWCTVRYAAAALGLKSIVSENSAIPIEDDLTSIFWYSFTCFRPSSFEKIHQRTMNMMTAYVEFYKMTRRIQMDSGAFNDVYMFIVKSFPSAVTPGIFSETPLDPRQVDTLLRMIQLLVKTVRDSYDVCREEPTKVTTLAREIYFEHHVSVEKTMESLRTDATNG